MVTEIHQKEMVNSFGRREMKKKEKKKKKGHSFFAKSIYKNTLVFFSLETLTQTPPPQSKPQHYHITVES